MVNNGRNKCTSNRELRTSLAERKHIHKWDVLLCSNHFEMVPNSISWMWKIDINLDGSEIDSFQWTVTMFVHEKHRHKSVVGLINLYFSLFEKVLRLLLQQISIYGPLILNIFHFGIQINIEIEKRIDEPVKSFFFTSRNLCSKKQGWKFFSVYHFAVLLFHQITVWYSNKVRCYTSYVLP